MAEKKRTRLRICELNPHLLCALCGGYLIDATTIVECLHSFCKTCILRYLETSNYCPICEVLIHKKRPWQNIRLDHTLQNAVYKLVPGLFKREMQRRRDFYEKNPPPGGKETEQVHVAPERIIFSEDEKFSVSLEFSPNGRAVQVDNDKSGASATNKLHHDKRFLLCPANVCIGHLKKFVRNKYTLPDCYQIDLFYSDEPLEDTYTLMDVAYIYSWRRENVLTLYYSFYQRPRKRRRVTASATASTQDTHTASSSILKTKASTTSANNTTTTATTTTSTVTIVEASDSGSTTEAGGTKTTVSVSLPSSTSLPLTLSLPLPPHSEASLLGNKTTNSLGFDEDDDDDDDERPLIIVTDTPCSSSATPMETDMVEGESGVTIIPHSRAAGSKKSSGGEGGGDADVGKSPLTHDTDFIKKSSSSSCIPLSTSSGVVSSSACSSSSKAANIPKTSCSSSSCGAGTVSVLPSSPSSSAEPLTAVASSRALSPCSAQRSVTKEDTSPQAVSTDSARPLETVCSNISQCQTDFLKPVSKSSCPERQTVPEPKSKRPRCEEPEGSVEVGRQSDASRLSPSSNSKEARSSHSVEAIQQVKTADPAQPGRCGDSTGPSQSASTAQPAGMTGGSKPSFPADSRRVEDSSMSAKSVFPAESCQSGDSVDSLEPTRKTQSLSESSVPGEKSYSEIVPVEHNLSASCAKALVPSAAAQPAEKNCDTSPSADNCHGAASKSAHSEKFCQPKDVPDSKERSECAESLRSKESTEGPRDSTEGQTSGENSRKEGRPVSSAKEVQSESSTSSGRSKSSSSKLGIFERIYTVTSNCTASGIKSIFKTTAIVPASASSRRYSDVSGVSPVAGIGERRASTGDGGTSAKKHTDKDKSKASFHKQKVSASRENRSSLDALMHLSKVSLLSSSHGSKTDSHKAASVGSEPVKSSPNLTSGTEPNKTSDKRQAAKAESGSLKEKASPNPAAVGSSVEKNSVYLPPTASSSKEPVNAISTTPSSKTALALKIVSGSKSKGTNDDRTHESSAAKPETKPSNSLVTGDLRIRLPKCTVAQERLSTAIDQLKQRQSDNGSKNPQKSPGDKSAASGQTPNASSHVSKTSTPAKVQSVVGGVKLSPASGSKPGEEELKIKVKANVVDQGSNNRILNQKKSPINEAASSQNNNSIKKEIHTTGHVEKRTVNTCSVTPTVSQSVSNSFSSVTSSKTTGHGVATEKTPGLQASKKTMVSAGSSSARPSVGTEGGKAESSAAVKRPHSATAVATSAPQLSATITTTNTNARLLPTSKPIATNADTRPEAASSSSHVRVSSINYSTDSPDAKRPKLSGSSQLSVSPHMAPTILSSSSVTTSSLHRPDGINGSSSTTSSDGQASSNKTAYCGNRASSGGVAKVRPSSNHASGGNKLLAPGQRVDSLLFKATSRMAAAGATATARLSTGNSLSASSVDEKKLQAERKIRSESIDSRMNFINKTFGGGRLSKEASISPAACRAEINFSARHILSPMFYTGFSRASAIPAVPRKSSPVAAAVSSPRTTVGGNSPKTTTGARDLSRKSSSSDSGKDTKSKLEGCAGDSSSRVGMESMKLDIPRLSTSSRDSVFASDPESSPTPSPKYSDINRNPIKLEPGSKLCRRETWVSAENGGRRSTGSVGSPNSLGSGPGSPLEAERSPARDARRPSDSELLLAQRWHGLHHHPHLLAIPHPRDPATVAAVAALYNGHFKVPPAAKYLPLAPEHVPRSLSPDPMPLDYSTSSSSGSSK